MPTTAGIQMVQGNYDVASLNLAQMDIETAMMMVLSRRVDQLEKQIMAQLKVIQARNEQMAKHNQVLEGLTTQNASVDQGSQEARSIEANIQAEKGKMDSLNNIQQLDLVRMQSLSAKRNEAYEMLSNFLKKLADSRNSIIGNMR